MQLNLEEFGKAMGDSIKKAVEPLLARIATLEKRIEELSAPVAGKDGQPGKDGEKGDIGPQGEKGADGLGMAGAMIDRDGNLLITFTNGEQKNLGQVVGKDGSDGKDGQDGLSLESFELEYIPEANEISIKASCGGRVRELRYPAGAITGKGYWRDGCKAKANDAYSYEGSLWIALKDNSTKPGSHDGDWFLAARKGRDGESTVRQVRSGPDAPVSLQA